jgi:glycosyltransferase involved in cell wall biosynthesis
MRVLHVVTSISREASGPSQSVPALCVALREHGVDASLAYVDYGATPGLSIPAISFSRSRLPLLRQAGWSPGLFRHIADARVDVIHVHGLWELPTLMPLVPHLARGIPVVSSPRGTLGPWALSRSAWKKRVALVLGQRQLLERAAFLHATSEAEAEELREFGVRAPIVVAPNVVTALGISSDLDREREPKVLFLSRLNPKKNVEVLLQGWPAVTRAVPNASLEIVGPDEGGYSLFLQRLALTLGLKNVSFRGALHGAAKEAALADADVFAFPTRNENFGMVVAEAMLAGALVVCSTGAPWQVVETESVGRWVPPEPTTFAEAIVNTLTLSTVEKRERRRRARQLVLVRFGDRAAAPIAAAYASVIDSPRRGHLLPEKRIC